MKKILLLLVSVMTFSSCSDFLDETNRNSITSDVLYSTPDGYENLVNACYSYTRLWYGKSSGFAFTEMGTDCYTGGGADCGRAPFMAFYDEDLQASQGLISHMWNALYSGLNTCNAAILRADASGMDEATKKMRLGEVHFLRALYLHLITETWGDVILYTDEMKSPVNTAQRTSVEDFYKQIFADLDIAIANLAGTPAKNNARVTQLAAKAFKARMCLYREDYTEAIKLAEEVVANPELGFYDSFKETFDMANHEGQTNKEAIWWVDYNEDSNIYGAFANFKNCYLHDDGGNHSPLISAMSYWMVPNGGVWVTPDTHAPWVMCMPTIDFLHMFDENIDQRYEGTFRTAWPINDIKQYHIDKGMQTGDTAFVTLKYDVTDEYRNSKKYLIYDRSDMYDETGKTIGTRDYFVSTYKFQDYTKATGWEYYSKRDCWVLRYGEMYLLLAEAYLQSGNKSKALQYINDLRVKRAIAGHEEEMKITEADLDLDFILDERARELAGEQHRWFDLKRTGKLLERVQKHNINASVNLKEYHLLRPIPQDELDALVNKDEFKQNPGYM